MTTLQVLLLDEAVQAIVKKFLSLPIIIGSILIILPSPFDLEAGIPLPILLIGIIIRQRTTSIAFRLDLEFHEPILIH